MLSVSSDLPDECVSDHAILTYVKMHVQTVFYCSYLSSNSSTEPVENVLTRFLGWTKLIKLFAKKVLFNRILTCVVKRLRTAQDS